jgi:hypothetical protein
MSQACVLFPGTIFTNILLKYNCQINISRVIILVGGLCESGNFRDNSRLGSGVTVWFLSLRLHLCLVLLTTCMLSSHVVCHIEMGKKWVCSKTSYMLSPPRLTLLPISCVIWSAQGRSKLAYLSCSSAYSYVCACFLSLSLSVLPLHASAFLDSYSCVCTCCLLSRILHLLLLSDPAPATLVGSCTCYSCRILHLLLLSDPAPATLVGSCTCNSDTDHNLCLLHLY